VRGLTSSEVEALEAIVARGPSRCGDGCYGLRPIISLDAAVSLSSASRVERVRCPWVGHLLHVDITHLGRLALRLARAAEMVLV